MRRENRILWLINHTTLRAFEVPLLHSLGFEVYTSKAFPVDETNLSASIDYSYDKNLTIPQELLAELNQHNFYSQPLSERLCSDLNKYFGTVVCALFPDMIRELVTKYAGRILLRVFGLAHPATYSHLLNVYCGKDMVENIRRIRHRVWLAQAFPEIADIEESWLKDRAVTLPLGLPESTLAHANTWTGRDRRIFFVCPRIASTPYYGKVYTDFKKTFGDLPHIIAGRQLIKVEDSQVTGTASDAVFQSWLKNCLVMFYHSQEPRHLHYHPLEAMAFGMPVIYMRGGILEKLTQDDQPGACSSFAEAREKVIRVLNCDTEFIHHLKSSQLTMLDKFKPQYARNEWQKNFVNGILRSPI